VCVKNKSKDRTNRSRRNRSTTTPMTNR